MHTASTLAGVLAAGATATVVAVGLSAAPASAASGDLSYSCEWTVDASEGTGAATASWDTAIADDLVVETGSRVRVDPYGGTVTLPDGFVAALRDSGRTTIAGPGMLRNALDRPGDAANLEVGYGITPVPVEGPMILDLEWDYRTVITADQPGTYTVLGGSFDLSVEEDDVDMRCAFDGEGDPVIDRFQAVGDPVTEEPTDTTAPNALAPPVRPALVQTDVAEGAEGRGPGLALTGGAAAVLLGLAGRAVTRRTPRRAARRH